MKNDRVLAGIAVLLLSAVFLAGMPVPEAHAAEQNAQQTVKVAVLNHTTYADQDENGVWSGVDVESMIDISQKAGFNAEFVDSSNDPAFLENLDNGTYDIVADITVTPEREENYLFTDEMMGTTTNTLAVRADDNRWDYGNIDQISDMKIGVLSTYANNADFRAWCTKHDIVPEIAEYENIDALTAALRDGEVDAEIYSAISGEDYMTQFRTILKFLPETYAFAFRKDDVELKNKVDAAVAQILSVNVDYFTNLKNKYETQYKSNILPLSSAEEKFISENPVIHVAVSEDEMPYYQKKADGTDQGIIPDYYQLIAGWTGFQFDYTVCDTYEEAVESVRNGDADILGMYGNGLISAYQKGFSLTDSISGVSCILLTKPGIDVSGINKIAVISDIADSIQFGFDRTFPDAAMRTYDNAKKCFDAVKSGEMDAALVGMYSATWLMNQTNSTAYSIVPISGLTYDVCAAVKEENQVLCSIMNKGIAATRENFIGITTRDTMPQNDLNSTISRMPPAMTISVVCALLALVLGLLWAIILLRRRQKERTVVLAAQAATEKQKAIVAEMQKNTEDRNRFFANISHDMRTPLNAVLGFASLAQKDGVTDEERKKYISRIQTSGNLLLELINDTLTLSKASSGKLELNPEPVRAGTLFESIIVPIRQEAERKKITFTADSSGALDRVIMVDVLNFQKILLNLLSNAIKFTPEGGHVSIVFYNDPPGSPNPDSVIRVSDDGIGMNPEFLPHVFEPFVQEKRQGYESAGTGLGLSIVKQLVDLMGGSIRAESEKGRGTIFTVRIHFEEAGSGVAGKAEKAQDTVRNLKGRRVLLCEDNELNREIAVALLKDRGIETLTAENGQKGVEMFAGSAVHFFDAVLMDVRMPVMDGYEATRRIRTLDRADAENVPIIAMTADAFADDIRKCLDSGMNGHIAKPVDQEKMMRVLSENIGRE